mmetsp:Transcript_10810/g.32814  ORF Transcript_10810/g.32814 Transcript_10810/m.32814 type:complete len:491 (-) Transcript_10810:74-1546(-)
MELVHRHHALDAVLGEVAHLVLHVGHTGAEELKVLLLVFLGEGLAAAHGRAAAVHLEGAHGGNEHGALRGEAGVAALDVEELLATNVGAEASLGHAIAVLADELERHLVGQDGAVAVSNVGEGACVHEHRGALGGLHEGRVDGLLHEYAHGASHAEVLGGDRGAGVVAVGAGAADDHLAEALAHVLEGGREGEHGHDLGGHGDVEARSARGALALLRAGADGHAADVAIARVEHALPGDGLRVDVEAGEAALVLRGHGGRVALGDAELLEAADLGRAEALHAVLLGGGYEALEELLVRLGALVEHARVDGGGAEVVRGGDGVDVASEVEVEVLHRHHLGEATAGGAALDAEGRALGRLADAGERLLVQVGAERLAHADGRRGLALAERGGVDARDHDVVAIGLVLQAVEDLDVDLAHGAAVLEELIVHEASGLGHVGDGQRGDALGDLDVAADLAVLRQGERGVSVGRHGSSGFLQVPKGAKDVSRLPTT